MNEEPKILIVRLLEACNAGCFMCDFAFSKDKYRFSLEEAKKLACQLVNTDIKLIRFTGGEPFLHNQIREILTAFKNKGFRVSIITNGYLLKENIEWLIANKVDQIIISVDSSKENSHDKFRKLPKLFSKILEGIEIIKNNDPSINIRINSVVGSHNIEELTDMYDLFSDLKIDQWSIIPLKNKRGAWKNYPLKKLIKQYKIFQNHVSDNPSKLKLLGYSYQWAGRTNEEIENLWTNEQCLLPTNKCDLVNQVLYYVPASNDLYPCNCIPHRSNNFKLNSKVEQQNFLDTDLSEVRNWLYHNGPNTCKGCEPINAALGDQIIDLTDNCLNF